MANGNAARFERIEAAGPDAPWMVMAHGASQDRRVFSRQVEAFRRDFRILLADLPGHGLSNDLPGPFGLIEIAESVEAALAEAGIAETVYWGTHTGAGAGLLLASRAPGRFRALILEGPIVPGRPPPSVGAMLAKVSAIAQTKGVAAAREVWWREGGWFDAMRSRPDAFRASAQRAMIDEFEGRPWLETTPAPRPVPPIESAMAGISCPVLIVNGEFDLPDFLAAAEEIAATIPGAVRATIPEAGGFPLWETPDAVNAAVRDFLDDISGGA